MAEPVREFGDLLTQGLRSIAARENKALLALEDELGYEIGVTRHAIEKWRQGNVPPDSKTVGLLAHACIRRGGMDRQWLLRFLTQARFPDKEALAAELFPEEGEIALPAVRHNLPRRPYERFIGREKELAELRRFLAPRHRVGVVSISGVAGVGKTALALEVAHRFHEEFASLPSDERFEAIVWVTAKRIELLPTGPVARRPTFTDLDGLYRALAEVLDRPAITRATNREEQGIIVARILTEHRVLLVLDNLEDVDDSALMVFLRDLPAPGKAIVTTRHRIDVAVPLHLRALNEAEAQKLIHSECQRHHLTLTEEQSEKLLRRTGGLPLAIVRTIGRTAWRGSSVEAELRQLGDPTSDIYDFCFEKSIALIRGKDAHRLFMALSLFATDADREALGHVAGFEKDILSRDEGLSDLEVLSLVNKDKGRFSLEPLTKIRAQFDLNTNPGFEHNARGRWITWYQALAVQAGDPVNYSTLQLEADNLLGVTMWLIEQNQIADAAWFFRQTRHFFFGEGHWQSLLDLSEKVASWAEIEGDPETLAAALRTFVRVARERRTFKQGEDWLDRVQIAAIRLGDDLLQAEIELARGRLLYSKGGFSEGVEAATKSLGIFRKHGKPERMISALIALGNLYLGERHFERAAYFYQQGLETLKECADEIPEATWWRVVLQRHLGLVAGRQGRYTEARDILYETLKYLTWQTSRAEVYAALALCEFHLGNIEQAHLLRRRVDRIIDRLGLARPICEEDADWIRMHGQEVPPQGK